MLAVPPAVLDELGLGPDAKVDLHVSKGKLVVERRAKPHYTLDELLAQERSVPRRRKDRVWLSSKPTGRELI